MEGKEPKEQAPERSKLSSEHTSLEIPNVPTQLKKNAHKVWTP